MTIAATAIPRAEIGVYFKLTGLTINEDKLFFSWLIVQMGVVIATFFYYVRKGVGILRPPPEWK